MHTKMRAQVLAAVAALAVVAASALADGMIVPTSPEIRVRGHWAVKHHQAAAHAALDQPDVRTSYVADGRTIAHEVVDRYGRAARRVLTDEALATGRPDRLGRSVEAVALRSHPEELLPRIVAALRADPDDERARSCWRTAVQALGDRALAVAREAEDVTDLLVAIGLGHADAEVRARWMGRLEDVGRGRGR